MTYWLVNMVTIILDTNLAVKSKTEMTFLMEVKEMIWCKPTMVMMKFNLELEQIRHQSLPPTMDILN